MSLIYHLHQPLYPIYYPLSLPPFHSNNNKMADHWDNAYSTLSLGLAILLLVLLLQRAILYLTSFPPSHPLAIIARWVWIILNTPLVTRMVGTFAFFIVYHWTVERDSRTSMTTRLCELPVAADTTTTTTTISTCIGCDEIVDVVVSAAQETLAEHCNSR